jgi:hypothetical protein
MALPMAEDPPRDFVQTAKGRLFGEQCLSKSSVLALVADMPVDVSLYLAPEKNIEIPKTQNGTVWFIRNYTQSDKDVSEFGIYIITPDGLRTYPTSHPERSSHAKRNSHPERKSHPERSEGSR